MKGVEIRYGDVAPAAKENFAVNASEQAVFADLTQLNEYNLDFPNYSNACEYGSVLLDGKSSELPDELEDKHIGYWSNSISNVDGTFSTPIVFTLIADDFYTSQGFTFTFDTYNNIYAKTVNIKWYRKEDSDYTLIVDDDGNDCDVDFHPDSAVYFCKKKVKNFNKVVITFYSVNMPYNRLKVRAIDYGYGTVFRGDVLRTVSVLQEASPIATELPASTCNFTVDTEGAPIIYSFGARQPVEVMFNDDTVLMAFIKEAQQTGKGKYNVKCEDYISQLSKLSFSGGIYESVSAVSVITSIFEQANIPIDIDLAFEDSTISGYIPAGDCREAVRQILFAVGGYMSTVGATTVKLGTLPTKTETIGLDRIRDGQSVTSSEDVSQINLIAHTYQKSGKSSTLYEAEKSGIGTNIYVSFSKPMYDLTITDGEIVSSTATYAVINANSGAVLSGYEYEDIQTVYSKLNPDIDASLVGNVKEIKDATLINTSNAQTVLDRIFPYLIANKSAKMKIDEGFLSVKFGTVKFGEAKFGGEIKESTVSVGDIITFETEFLGTYTGRITSQSFNLDGGILVKDSEVAII